MGRQRQQSDASLYHVMQRGVGRQLIFEDDEDRRRYLMVLENQLERNQIGMVAWCLMDNHTHLLFSGCLSGIAKAMQPLGQTYALYFNRKHDRVGHLFQDRYKSVPIEGEAQLLATLRYIHRNPVEDGIARTCRYRWSSYVDYLGLRKVPLLRLDTSVTRGLFEGTASFEEFHRSDAGLVPKRAADPIHHPGQMRPSKAQAADILAFVLESEGLAQLPNEDKWRRNLILRRLKDKGLSVRQIERLTGIGRNIIQRA